MRDEMQAEWRHLLICMACGLAGGLTLDWLLSPGGVPLLGGLLGLIGGARLAEPLQKCRERWRLEQRSHPFWRVGEPPVSLKEPLLYSRPPLLARLGIAATPRFAWLGLLCLAVLGCILSPLGLDRLDLRGQLLAIGLGIAALAVPLACATRLQVHSTCLVLRTPWSCSWASLEDVIWIYEVEGDLNDFSRPELVVHTGMARATLPGDPELADVLSQLCPRALRGFRSLWLSDWAELTGEEWLARHTPRPCETWQEEEWPNARNWS